MRKVLDLPDDCEFPQLHEIADEHSLRSGLARALGPRFADAGHRLERCRLDELYYSPGSYCRLLIKAAIHTESNGAPTEQLFFARIDSADAARRTFDEIDPQRLAKPALVPPILHIPEWAMVLWAYPNDPGLPGLSTMLDRERLTGGLERAGWLGMPEPPAQIESTLVKYVPGRRAGFLVRMESRDAAATRTAYAKLYRTSEGDPIWALARQIWDSEARQRGVLSIPEPYAFDVESGILWQEAFDGRPIAKNPYTRERLVELAPRIGACLAAFHELPIVLPVENTVESIVQRVERSQASSSEGLSMHERSCRAVLDRLLAAATTLERGPLAPVHGSFKLGHVYAIGDRVALIDFDGANQGDPADDVGQLVAHVRKLEVRGRFEPTEADAIVGGFLNGYRSAARVPVSPQRVAWAAAVHLAAGAVEKALKRLDTSDVDALLAAADRLIP